MNKLRNFLNLAPIPLVFVGLLTMFFTMIGNLLILIGFVLLMINIPIESYFTYKDNSVYFAKIKPDAIIPSKRDEDAGYDIYPYFEKNYMIIHPHETVLIPTGIASAFHEKYYMQLEERGSTGTKGIGQRCGVIDSGFRNEWKVPITNHNDNKLIVVVKDGITTNLQFLPQYKDCEIVYYPYKKALCQAVLLPVSKVVIKEKSYKDLLKIKSKRGTGMLGSSGK